jgi:large repetitive protein
VIGKVFDDRNMNGYQDGPLGEDLAAITDQTYVGGKFTAAPEVDESGEPGLPNVRLATVNGTIITTDEYGRYHVPCAELPADIGSNFTLKLDERSLPTGYRVTTENPRMVRLTAGGVTKLNFGAAIANVVDIDLTATAFVGGTAEPTGGLLAGIEQLVSQLADIPSVLRLTYYMNGEGRDLARTRLDVVEDLIRERWEEGGRYRLLIERTIRQVQ